MYQTLCFTWDTNTGEKWIHTHVTKQCPTSSGSCSYFSSSLRKMLKKQERKCILMWWFYHIWIELHQGGLDPVITLSYFNKFDFFLWLPIMCVSVKVDCWYLLMVEFVEVLHVSKDDVLFIDDSWRNLLHSARHLPQVSLRDKIKPT